MLRGVLCIYYEKDALTKFTREHPEVSIRMPVVTIIPPNLVYSISCVSPVGEEDTRSLLDFLKRDNHTLFVKTIQKRKKDIKLALCRKKLGETEKALYLTRSFLNGAILIKKGVRYYPVFVKSYKDGKKLEMLTKEYLGSQGSVLFKLLEEDKEPSFVTIEDILAELSEKEKECLIWAYELGYFEWPRIHDASEISKHLNISRTTFHEHIRRAEKKVMKHLYKALNPQKGAIPTFNKDFGK